MKYSQAESPPDCSPTKKRQVPSFTFLFIIVFLGCLSAIFILPSFLPQTNKATSSEARMNVGAMLRSQQAYYFKNSIFADSIEKMGLEIKLETVYFRYEVYAPENFFGPFQIRKDKIFFLPSRRDGAVMVARSQLDTIQSHAGGVSADRAVLCRTENPSRIPPIPLFSKDKAGNIHIECPAGSRDLLAPRK